jgi:hypothetical protein
VLFTAGGIATPADAAMMMQLGADGVFVGSGIFKSGDPEQRARAIVEATTHFEDPQVIAKVSRGLGEAMVGIEINTLPTTRSTPAAAGDQGRSAWSPPGPRRAAGVAWTPGERLTGRRRRPAVGRRRTRRRRGPRAAGRCARAPACAARCGAHAAQVRTRDRPRGVDGLILPGR